MDAGISAILVEMKRKTTTPRRRVSKRKPASSRIRPLFLNADEPPEIGVTYWVIHAMHWCALLVVVTAALAMGRTLFAAAP